MKPYPLRASCSWLLFQRCESRISKRSLGLSYKIKLRIGCKTSVTFRGDIQSIARGSYRAVDVIGWIWDVVSVAVVTLDDAILGWCVLWDKLVKSSWRIFLMKFQFSGWISALVSRSFRIMPLAPFADPFKRVEVKEELEVRYLSPELLCVGWGWSHERILLTRMQCLKICIAWIKMPIW